MDESEIVREGGYFSPKGARSPLGGPFGGGPFGGGGLGRTVSGFSDYSQGSHGYGSPRAAKDWEELQGSFGEPWRALEAHNIAGGLLDAGGLAAVAAAGGRVLDAGCGEGRWVRALAAAGAAVTGVDASEALVAAARAKDPASTYAVVDMLDAHSAGPPLAGAPFAAAACLYVLHMAKDAADLRRMCAYLVAQLAPGAPLAATVVAGEYVPEARQTAAMRAAFGFASVPHKSGAVLFRMGAGGGGVVNYLHSEAEYRAALEAAGFEDVKRVAWTAPPALEGSEIWKLYGANPHVVNYTARKRA
jgi:2-polyprenyl-3-methyl-5-hydroxy-6-metoxy-1,4-benzoquinol methylase